MFTGRSIRTLIKKISCNFIQTPTYSSGIIGLDLNLGFQFSDCGYIKKYICMMSPPESNSNLTTLNKLGLNEKSHVKIKNPEEVNKILSSMINSGFDKLQIIADYDRTITRFWINGECAPSSFGVLDNSPLMPPFYREESLKLLHKYYPIEIDPKLTEEEKIPFMLEWYSQVHALLAKTELSKDSIEKMVEGSNIKLRDGTEQLFSKLNKKGVPVLVFSAGMGDILEQTLRQFSVYSDNVKVVANFFKYNEQNVMVGFEGKLIHMYNKNESAINKSNYFEKLKCRDNIILMGDSLGDIQMSHGVPQPNNTLKIGFLNDKIEERLESYLNAFDIVLTDDQTMDIPQAVIQLIEEGSS